MRRASLVDQAIEALRAQIAGGTWPVGERIPTEPELVATLGIGRNSLREATRALVHAGLLETRQGDGTYVRATSDLAGALRRRARRAELLELVEVRRALEVEAARLAAERRTDADVTTLARLLDERAAAWAAGTVDAFVEADVAFHEAIFATAGNRMLEDLYGNIADALRAALRGAIEDGSCPDPAGLHDPLLAAIRAGDADAAQAATAEHVETMTGWFALMGDGARSARLSEPAA